jgi:hypothetical protein
MRERDMDALEVALRLVLTLRYLEMAALGSEISGGSHKEGTAE